MATPKTAEFRIARQRTELILTQPFFGALALCLVVAERDDLPTMATDGVHLFYNRTFVDGMTDSDLRGVIAHEVLHCVYDHCGRPLGRGPVRSEREEESGSLDHRKSAEGGTRTSRPIPGPLTRTSSRPGPRPLNHVTVMGW